jgi:hypothetical protein
MNTLKYSERRADLLTNVPTKEIQFENCVLLCSLANELFRHPLKLHEINDGEEGCV